MAFLITAKPIRLVELCEVRITFISFIRRVVMDVIKMELEVDPLARETCDNTDLDEKPVPEELSLLNLTSTEIKMEFNDYSNALSSEIKFEETLVPVTFPEVKKEVEEESCVLGKSDDRLKVEVKSEENEALIECYD
ncbi:uncharacterized protein [Periplaneta americana]|uniref:uncharacterized protein isoform X2 n=1 Tax=Periplaneta americana TaxID=6978 RepID=UPI0037E9ACD2